MNKEQFEKLVGSAVDEIMNDINDREGLRDELSNIDDDTLGEIWDVWVSIIMDNLEEITRELK